MIYINIYIFFISKFWFKENGWIDFFFFLIKKTPTQRRENGQIRWIDNLISKIKELYNFKERGSSGGSTWSPGIEPKKKNYYNIYYFIFLVLTLKIKV